MLVGQNILIKYNIILEYKIWIRLSGGFLSLLRFLGPNNYVLLKIILYYPVKYTRAILRVKYNFLYKLNHQKFGQK